MAAIEFPHLVFTIAEETYAISTEFVREMLLTPDVTIVPKSAPEVRGVINLRGKVIPVVDLRLRFGIKPLNEEFNGLAQTLQQRKQDHINWLTELEASIHEKRDFKLSTNPHECKFGIWYYSFKTKNPMFMKHLPRFEEPHNAIHETAAEVLAEMRKGNVEQALAIIEHKRATVLEEMIQLFDTLLQLFREMNTEISLVLASNIKSLAITVDQVLSVEHLPVETLQDPPNILGDSKHIHKIGRRKNGALVSVLNPDRIFNYANIQ